MQQQKSTYKAETLFQYKPLQLKITQHILVPSQMRPFDFKG